MGLSQSITRSASISLRLQNVNKAYQKRLSLRRSRSNTANSVTDNVEDAKPKSLPYHTIVIDCAPITFVDSMGTRALYQVCVCVCVCACVFVRYVYSSMYNGFSIIQTPVYQFNYKHVEFVWISESHSLYDQACKNRACGYKLHPAT